MRALNWQISDQACPHWVQKPTNFCGWTAWISMRWSNGAELIKSRCFRSSSRCLSTNKNFWTKLRPTTTSWSPTRIVRDSSRQRTQAIGGCRWQRKRVKKTNTCTKIAKPNLRRSGRWRVPLGQSLIGRRRHTIMKRSKKYWGSKFSIELCRVSGNARWN